MRRVTPLAVALVAVLATGGAWAVLRDGDGDGPSAACRVGGPSGRFAPFRPADSMQPLSAVIDERTYTQGLAWLAVDSPSQLRRDGDLVRLVEPRRLGGRLTPPESFRARHGKAGDAVSELEDGASVVFVVTASPSAVFSASLRPDGSVTLLGDCNEWYARVLGGFVARRNAAGDRRSAAQIFTAFASDPALVAALRGEE